ncbi:rhodanese-like domain-containing protein [Kineococcus arenarius]|uniref:rhodanese-like domain-containing protein n=1 Tax=Kineococcus sp. SYSU DK007 TaxID=3383128 RepID=UPI003D7F0F65
MSTGTTTSEISISTTTLATPTPATSALERVDATTLTGLLRDPDAVTVLDVRSPGEFEAMHIAGSYNVPLQMLGEHAAAFAARLAHQEEHHRNHQVVLVCQSGARATQARQHLAGVGTANLHVLDGGVSAFAAAGGDVVRGAGRWAMDRQVRLVAGSIVLASTLASLALPKARFLAGGIGAGLTYSAISNSCAMGALLGKLPYNRGPKDPDVAQVLDQLPDASSTQQDSSTLDSRA